MGLSIVTFKWRTEGYRATFTAEHVNTLCAMVGRHYASPHRFICFTDDPEGLSDEVEHYPIWDDYATVPNPTGGGRPSCYRRLKMFDPALSVAGPRFVVLDLDCVILDDLSPLFDRDEDAVFWKSPTREWPYNGAMFMANAGARPQVWDDFDPILSPQLTASKGYRGSDQAWISYCLGEGEAVWTEEDGVYFFRMMRDRYNPPKNARIVFTTSGNPPWELPQQWIKDNYR